VYPESIQKLIDQFSKFPAVGPKAAARFAFYLFNSPREEKDRLIKAISNLSRNVKQCSFCFKSFEGEESLCSICSNTNRDRTKLCLVEKEVDLNAIEKTKKYKGVYFILGGTISHLKNRSKKIKIAELIDRIKDPIPFHLFNASFEEIIIATNPTVEGETTARFIHERLDPLNVKITKLGKGLPVGGELEYADNETLEEAFKRRI